MLEDYCSKLMRMKHTFLSIILLLFILTACVQSESQPTATPSPTVQLEAPTMTLTPTASPQPTASPVTLRRGVNFGNMLEAPNEGAWGLSVKEDYFDLVKEVGFDFVRLPVKWSAHAAQDAPYTIDPVFFARIDEIVNWALQRDLTIIVNIHHYDENMPNPSGNKDRYLGLWKQIAEHYQD